MTIASKAGAYRAVHVNDAGCRSGLAFEIGVRSALATTAPPTSGAWIRDGVLHLVGDGMDPATVTLSDLRGSIVDRREISGPGKVDLRSFAKRGCLIVRVEQSGKVVLGQNVLLLGR